MVDNIDDLMAQAGFSEVGKTVEQPKVETVTETTSTQVDAPDTKIETNVQANDDKKPETKEVEFNIDTFNKAFKRDFKSVDEINGLFGLSEEYTSLKAKYDTMEKLIAEKENALKEQFNPLNYFANEQEFKINQILKTNQGLNEEVVRRVVSSDLEKLSDKDVLKLNEQLTTKGIFDSSLLEDVINDKYGLDVNKEELEGDELKKYQVKEYLMKKDAQKAREDLKKISEVQIPEFKDPNVVAQEKDAERLKVYNDNKAKWEVYTDKLVKDMDKMTIEYKADGNETAKVDFAYDDDFKAVLKEKLPDVAAKSNIDLNNQAQVNALLEQVNKDYLWLRRSELIKSAVDDIVTKMTKEQFDKFHNTSKPKSVEAPVQLSDEQRHNEAQVQKMLSDFGIKV